MAEIKSRKPANTAFKQQRLKSWQPLLTPKTVLPTLFAAGIVFAPLGGLFLYESETVNEIVINYTGCDAVGSQETTLTGDLYSYKFTSDNSTVIRAPSYKSVPSSTFLDSSPVNGGTINQCFIKFSIPMELKPPIYIFYQLTNFYQNHRKYVKSLNYNQLAGEVISQGDAAASCTPVATDANNKIYYPCGLIANSMFNDSFSSLRLLNPANTSSDNKTYTFSETGIAWPSDKQRFKMTSMPLDQITPPPNWIRRYPNYTADNLFNPQTDEHFQVWMRTSWYPTFRKLYSNYQQGDSLAPGTYEIQVDLNYNITAYGGTKSIIITGTSFLGDRNAFMGLAYIIFGCVAALFGITFLGWHFFRPR
ncbi:CDC50/LEM3 family [Halteromyces radiatus]|uniref:CDC50/LEM3 family n=1 Tax=Halteromyces radiatus TaxID=101107 RepID=UPI00221FF0D0|nr:CDC50/LEM3 family [Halteromyces radiatus]KAI8086228.1 CDC50/LEM3 family [Halteromyces radiatus]